MQNALLIVACIALVSAFGEGSNCGGGRTSAALNVGSSCGGGLATVENPGGGGGLLIA